MPEKPSPDLPLSPSEQIGYNAANQISGARGTKSTQRALASITLGFEIIIIFLTGLTLFGLNILVPRELGIWAGVALCLLCVLALALMRFGKFGIYLGWVVQGCLFLSALWLPAILVVAVMFGALWVYCMFKGAKIDSERAAFFARN